MTIIGKPKNVKSKQKPIQVELRTEKKSKQAKVEEQRYKVSQQAREQFIKDIKIPDKQYNKTLKQAWKQLDKIYTTT